MWMLHIHVVHILASAMPTGKYKAKCLDALYSALTVS
jgi:uncharacterized protein (DUF3820 family)